MRRGLSRRGRERSSATARSVLGLSADYHDAAACVIIDGVVVAAAEEERFTRNKHDPSLPRHAIAWCLEASELGPGELDAVVFYSKPLTTFERIVTTHAEVGPQGFSSLAQAVRVWPGSKLWMPYRIERALREIGHPSPALYFSEHHLSHAASAFYPSPFESAATLTFDGVGEWATSSIGTGRGGDLSLVREQRFPDSLGLFYSAMTVQCGFEANDGEYKLMGLAPYGEPRYRDRLLGQGVVQIAPDGSVHLDQRYFRYRSGRSMGSPALDAVLDGPARPTGVALGQREADVAASAQRIIEEAVLATARHARELTGERRACLAGGVALNCVANGRLLDDGPFDEVWVQPAAGDSGGAVGAALWLWHQVWRRPRAAPPVPDGMSGAALGPSYATEEIAAWLADRGVPHAVVADDDELHRETASALEGGAVVGWFRGRMEFGPRALGHRSILADPRDPTMIDRINRAVKGREGFRPFAPSILAEHASAWFAIDAPSPYMLFTRPLLEEHRRTCESASAATFADRLGASRSTLPACTHVDHSGRVQTVDALRAPDFHALLTAFHHRTGCPVLLNTSFNRHDEPIVRTPADALRSAIAADLDLLVLEGCLVRPRAAAAAMAGTEPLATARPS